MKKRKDIINHVAEATGIARQDVGKVVEAAFAFVRDSALAGADVAHPSLGRIRVKVRTEEGGEARTSYRYLPSAESTAGGKRGKGRRAPEAG